MRCSFHQLLVLFTLSFSLAKSSDAEFILSEFLASSSGASQLDEDGDDSDWIEIHNTGNSTASLAGYRLTDDETDGNKWVFPSISLAADSYLVLFASGKNRRSAGNELHTNFKLSSGGEYLALLSPAGEIVTEFAPSFPEQSEDISYGIGPDGVAEGYFPNPTPGSTNSISPSGQVADTQFSVQRGFYDSSFSLEITTETVDATIRYTLNGSSPTLTNGFTYNGPLTISGTTVVRAAAFKSGFFPTNIDTQSYLFPADIRTQHANGNAPPGWPSSPINGQIYDFGMDPEITNRYSAQEMENALTAIPSALITTAIPNLTRASDGIYSNADTRGLEVPAHLEIIAGDDTPSTSVRCGLRIRGGSSRSADNPKHAFRLFFKEQYGNAKFNYPLFEEEGVDEFDKIDFRTAQNYSWSFYGDTDNNTFLREVLARDLQAESGQPYTRSRYYHLYLNGIYWGLFMTQERAEANWGSSYLKGGSDEFDTIKSSGSGSGHDTEATDGNINGDWRQLWVQLQNQVSNPSTNRYLAMQGLDPNGQRNPNLPVLLDVDNLIDYMLIIGYTGAYDSGLSDFVGASNNWFSLRNAVRDDQGFSHFLHDAEHSLGAGGRWNNANDRINTTDGFNDINDFSKSNPQFIHVKLAQTTPEYRQRFADRAHRALFNGGFLTTDQVLATLEKRRQVVDSVIIAESARWGDAKRSDPADRENWENAVQSLVNTINSRLPVFMTHLRQGDLYPETEAPTFSPFESEIGLGNNVALSASEGIIYYTTDGSDPRLPNNAVNPNAAAFDTVAAGSGGIPRNSTWRFNDSGVNLGSSSIVAGTSGYSNSNWKHPNFNDNNWLSGAGILGFGDLGEDGDFAPIATPMGNGTAGGGSNPLTSYLRHRFTLTDVNLITELTAEVLADDGIVVYLNGVEVQRTHMPAGEVTFNTTALDFVGGDEEQTYFPFSIDPALLQEGENVLAVELHQANTTSSDLGFDMEVNWTQVAATSIPVNSPITLNARILANGEWSALVSNYYTTGSTPSFGELLISEVHYHPADPSSPAELAVSGNDNDYEFIELTNISNRQLELRNCALTEQVIGDHLEGVRFQFSAGELLAPGQKVVIVSDLDAFLARYPAATNAVAGEFEGSLGNSGEWLRLLNADGEILSSFRYNDVAPWPTDADGNGFSLQLSHLTPNVNSSDPLAWLALTSNGSPGVPGPGPFVGDPDSDFDNDGITGLVEYFAGTSDQDANSRPPFEVTVGANGTSYTFQRNPEAFGLTNTVEQSVNLLSWSEIGPEMEQQDVLIQSNGTVLESYQSANASPSEARQFFRLHLQPTN